MPDLLNIIPKSCTSCRHLYKMITEEPCYQCNQKHDKWEPEDPKKE